MTLIQSRSTDRHRRPARAAPRARAIVTPACAAPAPPAPRCAPGARGRTMDEHERPVPPEIAPAPRRPLSRVVSARLAAAADVPASTRFLTARSPYSTVTCPRTAAPPAMFESLGEKFDSLLRKLRGQGKITERNIEEALRDVRLALLEADVNLNVVRDFVEAVKRDALGAEVLRSLTPEQHFVRLVHRELTRLLGERPAGLDLGGPTPVILMLVGLNGSGKTTTTAKLARWLHAERGRTPYLVPADVYRPAATLQLETLARELGLPVHPATAGGDAVAIAREGGAAGRARGPDTRVVDTAGRP